MKCIICFVGNLKADQFVVSNLNLIFSITNNPVFYGGVFCGRRVVARRSAQLAARIVRIVKDFGPAFVPPDKPRRIYALRV